MYPILLQIGEFSISTYSIFLAFAFIAGTQWAILRALAIGISKQYILILSALYFFVGVAGAKLTFVLLNILGHNSNTMEANLWGGLGAVQLGGVLPAAAAGVVYMRIKKLPVLRLHDVIALPAILGVAIGRVGCFFNGCCFGKMADCSRLLTADYSHTNSLAAQAQIQLGASCLWAVPLWSALDMIFAVGLV